MKTDTTSIVKFAQALIRTPSQGGIDPYAPVVDLAYEFAKTQGLSVVKLLDDKGGPVAVVAKVKGGHAGKTWAVNATLDTAPAGDRSQWHDDPFSGTVENNVLHGRGAGDSKLAASMFLHLAKEMQDKQQDLHGDFLVILDADEHTGKFEGIKAALKAGYKPDGIMIGYAGDDKIVVGSRGFSRYKITLSGKSAHSGATAAAADNALVRAADIIQDLSQQPSAATAADFDKPPKVTVTQMEGGSGFSVVPASAEIYVDTRLTPAFDEAAADRHIRGIAADHDQRHHVPPARATTVDKISSEPPFLTPASSALRTALRESVEEISGKKVPEVIAGPSNIGNFLAKSGIEVTAGYGVPAKGVHASDERAQLSRLPKVYSVYRQTLRKLLKVAA